MPVCVLENDDLVMYLRRLSFLQIVCPLLGLNMSFTYYEREVIIPFFGFFGVKYPKLSVKEGKKSGRSKYL